MHEAVLCIDSTVKVRETERKKESMKSKEGRAQGGKEGVREENSAQRLYLIFRLIYDNWKKSLAKHNIHII